MRHAVVFLVLLIAYGVYEFLAFPIGVGQSAGELIVYGYIVVLFYLLFAAAISIVLDLWRRQTSPSTGLWLTEKVIFIYALLFWRHLYNPADIMADAVALGGAAAIAMYWIWRSKVIANAIVILVKISSPGAGEDLIPGATNRHRLSNGALCLIVLAALPVIFRQLTPLTQ